MEIVVRGGTRPHDALFAVISAEMFKRSHVRFGSPASGCSWAAERDEADRKPIPDHSGQWSRTQTRKIARPLRPLPETEAETAHLTTLPPSTGERIQI